MFRESKQVHSWLGFRSRVGIEKECTIERQTIYFSLQLDPDPKPGITISKYINLVFLILEFRQPIYPSLSHRREILMYSETPRPFLRLEADPPPLLKVLSAVEPSKFLTLLIYHSYSR